MSDFIEHGGPSGPTIIQELQRRLDRMEEIIRSQRIESTPTVRATPLASGTILEVALPPGAAPSIPSIVAAPLNMVYRGEWNAAMNYSAGDCVTVNTGGDNSGLYIATQPLEAGLVEPGNGDSRWVRLGTMFFNQFS